MSSDTQCEKLENLVHEILDRHESPSEDSTVARHAAECTQCAEFVAACEAMLDGVNALPMLEPSEHFLNDVLTSVASGAAETKRSQGHWLAMAASLAVAASLLVAVTSWWLGKQTDQPSQIDIAVTTPDQQSPTAVARISSYPFHADHIHAVCHTTGLSIATFPKIFRRVVASPESSNLVGKIRPITRPVGVVWEILTRTLPADTESNHEADGNTGWFHSPYALPMC